MNEWMDGWMDEWMKSLFKNTVKYQFSNRKQIRNSSYVKFSINSFTYLPCGSPIQRAICQFFSWSCVEILQCEHPQEDRSKEKLRYNWSYASGSQFLVSASTILDQTHPTVTLSDIWRRTCVVWLRCLMYEGNQSLINPQKP